MSWLLQQPVVTSVIIGAKNDEQLTDNLAATEVELSADELTRLNDASTLPPEYPGWMLSRQAQNRYPEPSPEE